MTDQTAPRGTPPNDKQLKQHLGARKALWDGMVEMVKEYGATWRWAFSDKMAAWSYRAYEPGERFLVSLSLVPGGFEMSLNMRPEEWDWVAPIGREEQEFLFALRDKALASDDNPAWLHIAVQSEADLPAIAKLLFARGRRVQAPRGKKRR